MHFYSLSLMFLAGLLLYQVSEGLAGIASLRKRWPPDQPISVCFFGGPPESRAMIAKTAREWTDGIGVSFDFGREPEFNDCDQKRRYGVRVGFAEGGFWSYVGTDSLRSEVAPPDTPSLNLAGFGERFDPERRADLLRAFGRALGMIHAEQDPQTNCQVELTPEAMPEIKPLFFPPKSRGEVAPNTGEYISTGIDKRSVMRLFTRPEFFKRGEQSQCYGPPTDSLSEGDRSLAKTLYPSKPSDVSPYTKSDISSESKPRHLTIRFEGVLAVEHFGYVLAALYDKGKITLKQYVARGKQTIDQVIAEERLAPRGITAGSLDAFLCRVNPHICVDLRVKSMWRNIPATRNYVDQGQACGDKSLPKFVFCVPNIRLEPYTQLVNEQYNGRRDSLKQIVITKYRGCDAWDDACQTLIKRLNRQYEKAFVEGEQLLPRTFAGELRIPSQAYRLVVEYTNERDREILESAINDVINVRAKQLNITHDAVAIQLTYPISNPKEQGAKIFSEPVQGYIEPLQAMSYPYTDEATEAELIRLRNRVHIGIWDTRVDAKHCDLDGLIHPINTDTPASTPPPDDTKNCGEGHPDTYSASKRYDHATGVAGLLAAKINGQGIAGIFPGTKIWAWEVLDGNQFNTEGDPLAKMLQMYDLDPKIINISQTYDISVEGKKTNLENLLFGTSRLPGMHKRILLVAAAGMTDLSSGDREGVQIDTTSGSECTAFPACWSHADGQRNLISVVALNLKGDDLLKEGGKPFTNFGFAFDVAAVGEVKTTLHGNWTGTMRGSSVAAPYVTGLAALLYAKASSLAFPVQAHELKQRILFTADNPPEISQFSRYGRINFWKALNFEDDMVQYDRSIKCPDGPCWKKIRINRSPTMREELKVKTGMLEGTETVTDKPISFRTVRSIKSDGGGGFTVLFVEGDRLKRIVTADIVMTGNKIVQIGTDASKLVSFDLQDLKEYVSCSFYDYCSK